MHKLLTLLFLFSLGISAEEFTGDVDILGDLTLSGNMTLGGISATDILISTDGASSSDTVLVTAGYLNANTAGASEALRINAKVNEAGGITAGQVVYISGATGGFPQVSLSDNTVYSKADTLAIANETKADGQTIICTISGLLDNIDTSAFAEGAILYLGTSGNKTSTHPSGINAVQRIGHAVKINASTGSMIVELDPLTIINDHNGILRHQLVNQNAGTSASAAYTIVNDADHRVSLSLVGSGYTAVPGIAESLVLYNEGYNKTVNAVDGNFGFEWWTDVTDSHNLSSTAKMSLLADGTLETISQVVTHTSTANNDRALRLVQDAAGFGNVEAVDIQYATGAIGLGDDDAAVVINIDRSLSTGGDIVALEVLATEGSATAIGMLTAIGIEPLHQFSGTFVDAATVLVLAVDQTAALADGGAGSISTFVADDDTMTIGSATKFEEVEFLMGTVASGAGIAPTFEFSTGVGTWATFSPIDGTDGMRSNGELLWLDADIPTWATGTGTEYLIRVTRTRNNIATTPITNKVQIAAVIEFSWDENGDLIVNDIAPSGTVDGRDIATDGTKLDGIAAGATTDQTITLTGDVTGSGTGSFATTIAAGAVDLVMLADGTDGELITWSAAGAPTTVAVGTATHVLTSNGVGVAPTFQAAGGGKVLQTLHTDTNSTTTSSATIPSDNTIPQSSEGAAILTASSFTPTSGTSTIEITYTVMWDCSTNNAVMAFAFFDGSADAIFTTLQTKAANYQYTSTMTFKVPATDTSARVYSARMGANTAVSWTVNKNTASGDRYGGTVKTTLIIKEIAAP